MYRAHKMKGGTFQNYNDKAYLKLTDHEKTLSWKPQKATLKPKLPREYFFT